MNNNETNPLRGLAKKFYSHGWQDRINDTYDDSAKGFDHYFDALQSLPAEQPEKNKRSIKEDFIYWLEGVLTYNIDDGLREQLEAKLDILSQQPSQPEGKTAEQVADMYWMDRQKFVKEIEKYAKEYANQPRKEEK